MRKRRIAIFAVLLMVLVIIPAAARAQDITPINYGDSIDGRITDASEGDLYSFEGSQGDEITISLTGDNNLDVYLRLGDSQGNILEENDDISSNNLDAEIQFEIPEDGTYIIAALAYDKGRYTLTLDEGSSSQGDGGSASDEGTISYGDTVSGDAVDMENPVVYSFDGQAGDEVSVAVSSDDVDTYVVVADSSGNSLAENDDIDQDNLNSYVEFSLPANGTYLIGVYAYSAGAFTLELNEGSGGGGTTEPVDNNTASSDVQTGTVDDDNVYVTFPLNDVRDGQTITVDTQRTSGDLDLYVGLLLNDQVVAENDDRDQSTTDSYLEYSQAQAGDYTVVVTRYGYEEGQTSGDFEVEIKVSAGSGGSTLVSGGSTEPTTANPSASGYPTIAPTNSVADWTVLVYIGGDNNLEDFLENDLNEFELAGGSNQNVRIIALLDRSDEYDRANGNWTDTRLFEVGPDRSGDERENFPPTIDTEPLGSLGELDTSYGNNLLNFLVWGVQSYPAQRYAVIINDHGGAWYGTVTDDSGSGGLLSLPEMAEVFKAATQETGIDKFDVLINDACLMSGIEHYASVSPYFKVAVGSPEITLAVSFDMTLLTETLNDKPNIDLGEFGQIMADKYMSDMQDISPDTTPVLAADVTDLTKFDTVLDALNVFTDLVAENPRAYGSLIGQVRANSYVYTFFVPEDEGGPATNMDVGNFMQGIVRATDDEQLKDAAQGVIDALDGVLLYGAAGRQLSRSTSYYNIYFPARATDFDTRYFDQTPLQGWAQFLRDYFTNVNPNARSFVPSAVAGPAAPAAAPSVVPQVNITLVYPQETSVAFPIKVSMEVTGRNIAHGDFTVDQILSDGTAIRLETSRIVTEVVEDNEVNYVNLWNPGVDDSDFTWDVELPTVSDGTTTSFEQVTTKDSVSTIAGRYQYPGQDNWIDVTVIFDSEGGTSDILTSSNDSQALASIRLEEGGIFQVYRSLVTVDGRVTVEPGTEFVWPEDGLKWDYAPAPSGQYNLGFQVEAFGGTRGFNSTTVTVNNDGVDTDLRGYVDDDWGFIFQRPADWFGVSYFPDSDFLQTSDHDSSEYIFVYPVYDTKNDLEAIANDVLGRYDVNFDGNFTETTVGGKDGLEFEFTYGDKSSGIFSSRAVAVYIDYLKLGLVFSSEALDKDNMEANYQTLTDSLEFFNAQDVEADDTGFWASDIYTDNTRYPVPETWMPGRENGLWWFYTPDDAEESSTVAAVTVLNSVDDDSAEVLQLLLEEDIEDLPGYDLVNTETYYGEQNTWEQATFTHEGENGEEITGQMYVIVKDGTPYALWFEAPTEEFNDTFRDVFTVMLDGFKISDVEADSGTS